MCVCSLIGRISYNNVNGKSHICEGGRDVRRVRRLRSGDRNSFDRVVCGRGNAELCSLVVVSFFFFLILF